jgi:membrane protein YdbS with pleckstrin-like domain
MELTAMLTNEPMTETTTQPEPITEAPVLVSPAVPEGIVKAITPGNGTTSPSEAAQPGLDGEETVCEGHYSFKNFLGRMLFGGFLVLAWLFLAVRTWVVTNQGGWTFGMITATIVVLGYWLHLGYRYLRAYRGHHYRLTTRRLFVTTGFFRRRVDQLELLRIKDVYIQVSMIGDWLGIGNVVVISSEHTLPKAYLLGIEEPRRVMDLIWHHMRIEQDTNTTRVNPT